ncbi:MAG: hypothetical protein M0026_19120 [Nocardiopsaceae bacterium]|nr:hypothetical protein [Nocardiopsaceae bacterium]
MSGTSGRARFKASAPWFGAVAAAVLMLVASGCGGDDTESSDSSDSGAPKPESTYSEVVPAAEAPAPDGFSPVEIQGVKINAPEHWSIDKADGRLCMRPPGQDACAYGALQVIPKVAKNDPNSWPKKKSAYNKADGWAAEPDVCRSLATAEAGDVGVTGAQQEEVPEPNQVTEHADGRKSHHRVWTVDCANGDTFEVRLWFLPESDVAVYVWSADTQYSALYDEIAKSMDVSDYKK